MNIIKSIDLRKLVIAGLFCFLNFGGLMAQTNSNLQKDVLNLEYLKKNDIDDYILGKGDILLIKLISLYDLEVTEEKSFSNVYSEFLTYEVDGSGQIYLPRLENVYVEGLTLKELEGLLNKAYKNILRNPRVIVKISNYRPLRVFIDGEVENPGLYSVPGRSNYSEASRDKSILEAIRGSGNEVPSPLATGRGTFPTLYNIIKLSGGITPYSDLSNIQVIRNNPISKGGGKVKAEINFLEVIEFGESSNNIRILDGDIINVKRTETNINEQISKAIRTNLNPLFITVRIKGRVEEPGPYFVNRSSALNDAIQLAGNMKVLKGKIKLTRFYPDGQIETRNISYNSNSKRGEKNNPYLRNGDIITIQKGLIIKTSEVVTEVTKPFLGIYTTVTVLDEIFK